MIEIVETKCAPLSTKQAQLHLAYMTKTYRLMGVAFSADRARMTEFARAVEAAHAAPSPQLERHARAILRIGETIGVASHEHTILPMLPLATRRLFAPMASRVRPGLARRIVARVLGKLLVPIAAGAAT